MLMSGLELFDENEVRNLDQLKIYIDAYDSSSLDASSHKQNDALVVQKEKTQIDEFQSQAQTIFWQKHLEESIEFLTRKKVSFYDFRARESVYTS